MMTEDNKDKDGYFSIHFEDGFATLRVVAPRGAGKAVHVDDVLNKMRVLNIEHVSIWNIEEVVNAQKGEWVKVARWPEGIEYVTKLDVNITDDNMQAMLTIIPPVKTGDMVRVEEVLDYLHDAGVRYGIDMIQITTMVKTKTFNTPCVVARGNPAIPGKGASVKYLFNTEPGKPYLIDEYGRMNLKELNFINNVKKGRALAVITPPEQGRPGKDILDNDIVVPQLPSVTIKCGMNTLLDEKNRSVISLIDGNAFLLMGAINVEPLVTVHNVDYNTGNIHFDGSVQINGTIADGFTVEATGTIEVGECVGKVRLKAGKDIILKSGINGNHDGTVYCDGDLYAKFIESANITCYGNVYAEELILHSTVRCWKNVLLKGRRAEVCGGKIIAAGSIWCKRTGSINGIKTKLILGVEPQKLKEIEETKRILKGRNEEVKQIQEKITYYGANPAERTKIGIKMSELKKHKEEVLADIKRHETILHNCYEKLHPKRTSKLVVEETIFNGTKVEFGKEYYRAPHNDARRTILRLLNQKIHEEGFNLREPPEITD